jgi:uncharacterized protein YukE
LAAEPLRIGAVRFLAHEGPHVGSQAAAPAAIGLKDLEAETMAQIGADIQQLESLTRQFNTQASTVDGLISAINSQIGGTWWVGPKAEKFKNEWNGEFVPTLRKLSEALRNAGQDVAITAQRIQAAGS